MPKKHTTSDKQRKRNMRRNEVRREREAQFKAEQATAQTTEAK